MAKVKICGLTTASDAILAAEAGADMLGFILHASSPRFVTATRLTEIVSEVRACGFGVLLVGVFVNGRPHEVAALMDRSGLDLAQLSGDEPVEQIKDHDSPLFGRCYKVIHPSRHSNPTDVAGQYLVRPVAAGAPALAIDSYMPGQYGGTGVTSDWQTAGGIMSSCGNVLLAGGLNIGNVTTAIDAVKPFGVDVSSGIERAPGVKEPELVRRFIALAKGQVGGRAQKDSS